MSEDEPTTEERKRRQLDVERAEREELADADNEADAERHRRRADKAHYLREKLQEQEMADQQAERERRD